MNVLCRCGSETPERLENQILTDPHSPRYVFEYSAYTLLKFTFRVKLIVNSINSKFRVYGPLQNNVDFAQTFQCAVGTNMNPAKKCILW